MFQWLVWFKCEISATTDKHNVYHCTTFHGTHNIRMSSVGRTHTSYHKTVHSRHTPCSYLSSVTNLACNYWILSGIWNNLGKDGESLPDISQPISQKEGTT